MKEVFFKAGIEVTKENKKEVDRAIHSYVGVGYKDCSSTWRVVKVRLTEDENAFIEMLRVSQVSSGKRPPLEPPRRRKPY